MSLQANSFLYETMLKQVGHLAGREENMLAAAIERAAKMAWYYHPGRFADGALENLLLQLGYDLQDSPDELTVSRGRPRTLHVASEVYSVGGHSRVLATWVANDRESESTIVLTRQHAEIPSFLAKAWGESSVKVVTLSPHASILGRALQLRKLAVGSDRVILHHHPDDAVPVIAFAKPGGCPVGMFNHAHFWFCLGSSVADVVINTLPYFQRVSECHRFARATTRLKRFGGFKTKLDEPIDKQAAKLKLNLAPDRPVVMTIAQEHYFAPMDGYNFFATLGKLLNLLPELQVVVLGVSSDSRHVPAAMKCDARVRLTGLVIDPAGHYQAADVCLESFPMPSLGGFVEAVADGEAFPVPVYGPCENILRINQEPIASEVGRSRDEIEYLNLTVKALTDLRSTRKRAARIRRLIHLDIQEAKDPLATVYRAIDTQRHAPHELPVTSCSTAEDNVSLASFTEPDVGKELWNLPLLASVKAHMKAARLGHESRRHAARRSLGALARTLRSPFMRQT